MSCLRENGENGKYSFRHGARGERAPADLWPLSAQVGLVLTADAEEHDSVAMTFKGVEDCLLRRCCDFSGSHASLLSSPPCFSPLALCEPAECEEHLSQERI